jgi:hypothetical protein
MNNIKKYVLSNFSKDEIKDINNNGMACGFGGLIYYKDTCAFHDEYEDEIWQLLWDEHKELGVPHVLSLVASFNGAKNVGSMEQFKNLLCWYAVEHVCRYLLDNPKELISASDEE